MNGKYIRNRSFLCEDLGDGVLLLNTTGNQVIEMNQTGALLWRRLDRPALWNELVEELKSHYPDENGDKLEADVNAFLKKATACKAIEEL